MTATGISYKNRKKQRSGRKSKEQWAKYDGIEYSTNESLISQIFNTEQMPQELYTDYGVERINRSYIYIISKKIDGRTFLKIGMSNLGNSKYKISTRLESAQTFLIPGLEHSGFKLHYVFLYRREAQQAGTSYGELVERSLHKYLNLKFENVVVYMPSNHRSEWYLPEIDKYKVFVDNVLDFISVQTPAPEEAYHFKTTNKGILKREYSDQFMPKKNRADVLKYRHDHVMHKRLERDKEIQTKQQTTLKRGNKAYFETKLISVVGGKKIHPLGKDLRLTEIYYHHTKTEALRKYGEYYAQVVDTRPAHINTPPSKVIISFQATAPVTGAKKFYSHISHILEYMKQINTLDEFSMENNYHYYYNDPIKVAKSYLNRNTGTNYEYRSTECKWLIGRVVRSKNNKLYRVVEITETAVKKVDKIILHEIIAENLKFKEPRVVKRAEPKVTIQLAVDYHENTRHEIIKYNIDNSIGNGITLTPDGGDGADYELFDFIMFKPNFFKIDSKWDPNHHIGVILQKKWNYAHDKDTDKTEYEYQYEMLLNDDRLWELNTKSVDASSNRITSDGNGKKKIKAFLDKTRFKKNVIYRLYDKYGIGRPDVQQGTLTLPQTRPIITHPRTPAVRGVHNNTRSKKRDADTIRLRLRSHSRKRR